MKNHIKQFGQFIGERHFFPENSEDYVSDDLSQVDTLIAKLKSGGSLTKDEILKMISLLKNQSREWVMDNSSRFKQARQVGNRTNMDPEGEYNGHFLGRESHREEAVEILNAFRMGEISFDEMYDQLEETGAADPSLRKRIRGVYHSKGWIE